MIQLLKQLRPRFVDHKHIVIPALLIVLTVQVLQTFSPRSVGRVIQSIEQQSSPEVFWNAVRFFAVISMSIVVLDRFWRRFFAYFRDRLEVFLNNYYRAKLLQLDHETIISKGTGRISTLQSRGIAAEISLCMAILQIIGIAIPRFVLMLTMVAFIASWVTAGLILCAILVVWFVKFISKRVKAYRSKINKARERTNRITTRVTMEYQTVVLHNMQSEEQSKAVQNSMLIPWWWVLADGLNNLGYQMLYLCFILIELLIYIFLGYQALTSSAVTIAQIVILTQVIRQMWRPISILMQEFSQWNKHVSAYTSRQKFINTPATILDGVAQYRYAGGNIVFDQVGFLYPTKASSKNKKSDTWEIVDIKALFDRFSLDIPAGRTTALVGHSWSGKSTLVKLLLRLYDISSWDIRIDGQSLKTLQCASRYGHVWYVSQEPAVFDGTIRENLAYGLSQDKTDDQLWFALEQVKLASVVRAKDKGLNTQLGERGIKLSGGERQRLALARLILRDPEIIILDEPTSALDSISEAAITNIFKSWMGHKTILVIAHRLQTVMHADQIVVLEKGKVVQQWSHAELLAQEGVYKTLVDLQSGTIKE